MDLNHFNQILETATALHASGMDWLALAEVVKGLAAELDWPEDTEEWDDCLEDVIEADGETPGADRHLVGLRQIKNQAPPIKFRLVRVADLALQGGWPSIPRRVEILAWSSCAGHKV